MIITCTTTYKNKDGVEVSLPLSDGYVEVRFDFDENISTAEYDVYMEAIKLGSPRESAILLDKTLVSSTLTNSIWRANTVLEAGVWQYLSNLSIKYGFNYVYVLNEDGDFALGEDGTKIIDYQY